MTVYTIDNTKVGTYNLKLSATTTASSGSKSYNFVLNVLDKCTLSFIEGPDHANVVYSIDFTSPLVTNMGWSQAIASVCPQM
jgi:hypothetical protein